ncbi:hypothetical protein LSAT2_016523, partial [Lamellibrachia satsuma]
LSYSTSDSCSDEGLILQYDFENGFVDRCHNAPLVQRGSIPVELTKENGNTVACFDGNAFMQAPKSHWLDKVGWQQAVMVFDGENVKLYLQGYERERAPSEGFMLHGATRAFLSKLCKDKFFCGCMDNLRIWSRALTPGEVLYMQKN